MTEAEDWPAGTLAGRILYRDGNLIVLDKPPGLAVHGGPRTSVHLEGMLGELSLGFSTPPRLAHRLDRDTSGCLVLARHDKALSRLGRLFGAAKIKKTYWAVVEGDLDVDDGVVTLALSKRSDKSGWRMTADPGGLAALTRWRRRGRDGRLSWLELMPESGRTHQIRVHCAQGLSCPILGDLVYGRGLASAKMLNLHARAVVVPYWEGRDPVAVISPPPGHMLETLRRLGWREEA